MSPNLRFQCPACKSTLEAGVSHAGEKIRCLKCGQKLLVPTPPNANNKTVLAPMVDQLAPAPAAGGWEAAVAPPPPLLEASPDARPADRAEFARYASVALAMLRSGSRLKSILEWRRPLLANTLWPALLLFFLPWVNISCNGQVLLQQSGFQSCYGGATLSPQSRAMIEGNQGQAAAQRPESFPFSPLSCLFIVGLAAGLVCGAGCLICMACSIRRGAIALEHLALFVGAGCFASLVAQMAFGFPLERRLNAEMQAHPMIGVQIQYSAWFWMTLLLTFLSVPLLLAEAVVTTVDLLHGRRSTLLAAALALAVAISAVGAAIAAACVLPMEQVAPGSPLVAAQAPNAKPTGRPAPKQQVAKAKHVAPDETRSWFVAEPGIQTPRRGTFTKHPWWKKPMTAAQLAKIEAGIGAVANTGKLMMLDSNGGFGFVQEKRSSPTLERCVVWGLIDGGENTVILFHPGDARPPTLGVPRREVLSLLAQGLDKAHASDEQFRKTGRGMGAWDDFLAAGDAFKATEPLPLKGKK